MPMLDPLYGGLYFFRESIIQAIFHFSSARRLVAEKLNTGSFLALKNLEMFAYDMELNCLRIRATNQKHILILLPDQKVGDRITLFHEAP